MEQSVIDAAHDVLDRFFGCPTDQPLIIEPLDGGGVAISRGIAKARLTISDAAVFLGMSRPTLYKHYIDKRRLHVGTDGKISRKAVLTLFNSLDGKD